jgi:hypothetical protein
MGTLKEAVPVIELTSNFSPMSHIAPPPFGKESTGALEMPAEGDGSVDPRRVSSDGISIPL